MPFGVTHHPEIPAKHQSKWCGPAALSAATGLTAEECLAAINRHRRAPAYYQSQGTYSRELMAALRLLGFTCSRISWGPNDRRTLRRILEERPSDQYVRAVIYWNADHFVCVRESTLADNRYPDGIPWRKYRGLRAKVKGAIVVETKFDGPGGLDGWKPSDHAYGKGAKSAGPRRRAIALAKELDVSIHDDGADIELRAPAGRVFDGDLHIVGASYERGEKADAWKRVVELLEFEKLNGFDHCESDGCDCGRPGGTAR